MKKKKQKKRNAPQRCSFSFLAVSVRVVLLLFAVVGVADWPKKGANQRATNAALIQSRAATRRRRRRRHENSVTKTR